MKKILLAFACLLILLGWVFAFAQVWRSSPQSPAGFVPFTAHVTHVAQTRKGSVPLTIIKILALRSDGSYYESQTNLSHGTHTQLTHVSILNQESGRIVVISPLAKTITSYESTPRFSPPECTEEILAAPEAGQYMGYDVVETMFKVAPQGGLVQTTLRSGYAPKLNCLLMYQESRLIDARGNLLGTNIYRVNSITVGEPNPTLFAIPKDYTEASPSQAARMELELMNPEQARELQPLPDVFSSADEHYFSHSWNAPR